MNADPNIVHEAEVQRQHVRLQLPIKVQIGEEVFESNDWSHSGVSIGWEKGGIDSIQKGLAIGKLFDAILLFQFEEFEMALPVKCEVRFVNASSKRIGCRFVDLNPRQISLLQYFVSAYVSGEIVKAGDIMSVAGRKNFTQARKVPSSTEGLSQSELLKRKTSQLFKSAMVLLVSLAVAFYVFTSIYERAFVVEASSAKIMAETQVVSAPTAGLLYFQQLEIDQKIKKGQPLLTVETDTGKLISVDSPCNCIVKKQLVSNSQGVKRGQRILQLLPDYAVPYIEAKVPFAGAVEVAIGQMATLELAGGGGYVPAKVTRMHAGEHGSLTTIYLAPQKEIPVEYVDDPVKVHFDTLKKNVK